MSYTPTNLSLSPVAFYIYSLDKTINSFKKNLLLSQMFRNSLPSQLHVTQNNKLWLVSGFTVKDVRYLHRTWSAYRLCHSALQWKTLMWRGHKQVHGKQYTNLVVKISLVCKNFQLIKCSYNTLCFKGFKKTDVTKWSAKSISVSNIPYAENQLSNCANIMPADNAHALAFGLIQCMGLTLQGK